MLDFKLDTFYKDPSFHISFLWCLGDQVKLIESHLPQLISYGSRDLITTAVLSSSTQYRPRKDTLTLCKGSLNTQNHSF
uniref:U6 snRNA phosphodiesterase n=1 Tax=Glossina morsitans morsitans TaxID=37546 RepID=A0A1B0FL62_GLOMM